MFIYGVYGSIYGVLNMAQKCEFFFKREIDIIFISKMCITGVFIMRNFIWVVMQYSFLIQ